MWPSSLVRNAQQLNGSSSSVIKELMAFLEGEEKKAEIEKAGDFNRSEALFFSLFFFSSPTLHRAPIDQTTPCASYTQTPPNGTSLCFSLRKGRQSISNIYFCSGGSVPYCLLWQFISKASELEKSKRGCCRRTAKIN